LFDTIMDVFGRKMSDKNFGPGHPAHRYPHPVSEELQTIQGARVLLVEDNEINQQVASELLEQAGMTITVAENGQKGVEAVQAAAYDLVFMDMQMPVMDGYTATKEIRLWEKTLPDEDAGTLLRVPVVAMTAHAMAGEKEKCLAAGMDDYLSKPIDQDKLYAILLKWIKPGNRDISTIRKKPASLDEYALPSELPGIDLADGLRRLGGNQKLYVKLLVDFANKYGTAMEAIAKFMKDGNIPGAERTAHTIKGAAGNLAAKGVHAAAHQLEAVITGKDTAEFDGCLSRLAREIQQMVDSVKTIAPLDGDRPSSPDACMDQAQVAPKLVELARLLAENNADADQCFETVRKSIDSSLFDEEMKGLETHIGNFDFTHALEALHKIAAAMNITLEGKENG
jgi:two-component system, sensor histidine kinase and response regulator